MLIGTNMRASIISVGPVIDLIGASWGLSSVALGLLNAVPLLGFAGMSPLAAGIGRRLGTERALGVPLLVLTVGIVVRSGSARCSSGRVSRWPMRCCLR